MRMRGTRSLSSVHSDHRPQSFSLWTGHGRELSLTPTTEDSIQFSKNKAQRTLVVVHAALTVSFRTANTGLFVVIHNTVSQVSPVSREAAYPAVAQQVYRLTAVSRCPIILLPALCRTITPKVAELVQVAYGQTLHTLQASHGARP